MVSLGKRRCFSCVRSLNAISFRVTAQCALSRIVRVLIKPSGLDKGEYNFKKKIRSHFFSKKDVPQQITHRESFCINIFLRYETEKLQLSHNPKYTKIST